MRDLYQRLGLSRTASQIDIERAINACEHQALRKDAAAALGVPTHRVQYNDLHDLMTDLGKLRAELGMTHTPYWHEDSINDFMPTAGHARSHRHELSERLEQALVYHARRRWHLLGLLIALAGTALGTGMLCGYMLL